MTNFGIKELYDIEIKAKEQMLFCGRQYEPGEVLVYIDRAQFATMVEQVAQVTAHGGKEDKDQVLWRTTKPLLMRLEHGIISKEHLSLLTNNFLDTGQEVKIPYREKIPNIIGSESFLKFKYIPIPNEPFFIYTDQGIKLKYQEDFILIQKEIEEGQYEYGFQLTEHAPDSSHFIVDYYFTKENQEVLRIGKDALHGYLKLEAKTRVKDDKDGYETTGIFIIPKMRIMSDLSMQLGDRISPYIYSFIIQGEPVGSQGDTRVCDLIFLNEDINAEVI